MKRILCIVMAFVMLFCLAACGEKIVVNKKPHVEVSDMVYDETEIIVEEEFYQYCGTEYELIDLITRISLDYNSDVTFDIICEKSYEDRADQLSASLTELEIKHTINGEDPNENVSEDKTPTIITE